jgi:hypothetical protein
MKQAAEPFEFVTAPFLSRINNQVAGTLAQLQDCIAHASDASIFYHAFQSLGRHHFLTEGFSNDFAQWVLAALNRNTLAERLGGIDVRDYVSIAEMRADLSRMIREHLEAEPRDAQLSAFEPFYFCEAVEVRVPLGKGSRISATRRSIIISSLPACGFSLRPTISPTFWSTVSDIPSWGDIATASTSMPTPSIRRGSGSSQP